MPDNFQNKAGGQPLFGKSLKENYPDLRVSAWIPNLTMVAVLRIRSDQLQDLEEQFTTAFFCFCHQFRKGFKCISLIGWVIYPIWLANSFPYLIMSILILFSWFSDHSVNQMRLSCFGKPLLKAFASSHQKCPHCPLTCPLKYASGNLSPLKGLQWRVPTLPNNLCQKTSAKPKNSDVWPQGDQK